MSNVNAKHPSYHPNIILPIILTSSLKHVSWIVHIYLHINHYMFKYHSNYPNIILKTWNLNCSYKQCYSQTSVISSLKTLRSLAHIEWHNSLSNAKYPSYHPNIILTSSFPSSLKTLRCVDHIVWHISLSNCKYASYHPNIILTSYYQSALKEVSWFVHIDLHINHIMFKYLSSHHNTILPIILTSSSKHETWIVHISNVIPKHQSYHP